MPTRTHSQRRKMLSIPIVPFPWKWFLFLFSSFLLWLFVHGFWICVAWIPFERLFQQNDLFLSENWKINSIRIDHVRLDETRPGVFAIEIRFLCLKSESLKVNHWQASLIRSRGIMQYKSNGAHPNYTSTSASATKLETLFNAAINWWNATRQRLQPKPSDANQITIYPFRFRANHYL